MRSFGSFALKGLGGSSASAPQLIGPSLLFGPTFLDLLPFPPRLHSPVFTNQDLPIRELPLTLYCYSIWLIMKSVLSTLFDCLSKSSNFPDPQWHLHLHLQQLKVPSPSKLYCRP
jgi:hypothetical protein